MSKKPKIGPSKVPGPKAGPNGSFPIGDAKHARLAIGGATRSERAGNITPAQAASIKSQARAKLGKGKTAKKATKKSAPPSMTDFLSKKPGY